MSRFGDPIRGWMYAGVTLGVCLVSMLPSTAPAQEPDGLAVVAAIERSLVDAIATAEQSVVSIARVKQTAGRVPSDDLPLGVFNRKFPQEADPDDPSHPDFIPTDFGSGVVIGTDGPGTNPKRTYILTNYHVVKGGARAVEDENHPDEFQLYIRTPDRKGYPAKIFAADPRSDLAVVTILDADVKPIKMGDGSRLKKGQLVIALGNPYAAARDGSASASWGMVSNLRRRPGIPRDSQETDTRKTLHDLGDLIQVDTRLNLGTSGGALVNLKGELVGLTTSLAALAGYEKSSGFAIPIDTTTLRVIQSLREGKEVEYGFLGVSFGQLSDRRISVNAHFPAGSNAPEGAYVMDVLDGGPASRAGLQRGDIILNVNGERVFTFDDVTREINKLGPEAKARLTVWRLTELSNNHSKAMEVGLTKWGAVDEEGIVASNQRHPAWRGLIIDYSTARDRHNGELRNAVIPRGVLVLKMLSTTGNVQTELTEGSRITKVNSRSVSTPAEFYDAVKDLRGDVQLELDLGKDAMQKPIIKYVIIHE